MITRILVDNSLMSIAAGVEINMSQIGILATGQRQSISNYRKGHNVSGGSNMFSISLSGISL